MTSLESVFLKNEGEELYAKLQSLLENKPQECVTGVKCTKKFYMLIESRAQKMLTTGKLSNLQTILLILRHLAAESVSYFKKFLGFGLPQMHMMDWMNSLLSLPSSIPGLYKTIEEVATTIGTIAEYSACMMSSMYIFIPSLLDIGSISHKPVALRFEVMRVLNEFLKSCSIEKKRSLLQQRDVHDSLLRTGTDLHKAGDFELQVCLLECISRFTDQQDRQVLAPIWFDGINLTDQYLSVREKEFDIDCRYFLNNLNARFGSNRSVYSLPCVQFMVGTQRLPSPSGVKDFWIDFNISSKCLSTFTEEPSATGDKLWESVYIKQDEVIQWTVSLSNNEWKVVLKLKEPLPLPWDTQTNNILVTILFSSQHNPLQPLTKTLGEIKQGTMSLAANKQQTSGAKQQSLAANKQPTTRAKQQSLGSNRQPTTRAKQKQMMEVQETHCKKTSIASAPIRITQMKIPNMNQEKEDVSPIFPNEHTVSVNPLMSSQESVTPPNRLIQPVTPHTSTPKLRKKNTPSSTRVKPPLTLISSTKENVLQKERREENDFRPSKRKSLSNVSDGLLNHSVSKKRRKGNIPEEKTPEEKIPEEKIPEEKIPEGKRVKRPDGKTLGGKIPQRKIPVTRNLSKAQVLTDQSVDSLKESSSSAKTRNKGIKKRPISVNETKVEQRRPKKLKTLEELKISSNEESSSPVYHYSFVNTKPRQYTYTSTRGRKKAINSNRNPKRSISRDNLSINETFSFPDSPIQTQPVMDSITHTDISYNASVMIVEESQPKTRANEKKIDKNRKHKDIEKEEREVQEEEVEEDDEVEPEKEEVEEDDEVEPEKEEVEEDDEVEPEKEELEEDDDIEPEKDEVEEYDEAEPEKEELEEDDDVESEKDDVEEDNDSDLTWKPSVIKGSKQQRAVSRPQRGTSSPILQQQTSNRTDRKKMLGGRKSCDHEVNTVHFSSSHKKEARRSSGYYSQEDEDNESLVKCGDSLSSHNTSIVSGPGNFSSSYQENQTKEDEIENEAPSVGLSLSFSSFHSSKVGADPTVVNAFEEICCNIVNQTNTSKKRKTISRKPICSPLLVASPKQRPQEDERITVKKSRLTEHQVNNPSRSKSKKERLTCPGQSIKKPDKTPVVSTSKGSYSHCDRRYLTSFDTRLMNMLSVIEQNISQKNESHKEAMVAIKSMVEESNNVEQLVNDIHSLYESLFKELKQMESKENALVNETCYSVMDEIREHRQMMLKQAHDKEIQHVRKTFNSLLMCYQLS